MLNAEENSDMQVNWRSVNINISFLLQPAVWNNYNQSFKKKIEYFYGRITSSFIDPK
jgi:hypothetical protein